MIKLKFFLFLVLVFLFNSCSKEEKEISYITESRQDLEMVEAYRQAYQGLKEGDPYFSAKKFLEA